MPALTKSLAYRLLPVKYLETNSWLLFRLAERLKGLLVVSVLLVSGVFGTGIST